MGLDTRRLPLPAPTESMDETSGVDTEVATNITTRTDKSSYEIPEDGSPITISTQKVKGHSLGRHGRQKSQTSLLIEYFETSRSGDKSRSRPSVRVKVTPSGAKKGRVGSNDAVQITGIGADRKPSYTRRISLGSKNVETGLAPTEGTDISHSSESNVSNRPPVEIEVLQHGSDLSNPNRSSRGLSYAPIESNVSSMPPDSMLEGENSLLSERRYSVDRDDEDTVTEGDYLKAPHRTRSRSVSRERLAQKVAEKITATTKPHKSSRSDRERSGKDQSYEDYYAQERRRRPSKSHRAEDETISGVDSSLVSSNVAPSQKSYRSGSSQASRMTNNPRLLEMVEDTIKRMILPEINAIKEDRKTDRNLRSFDEKERTSSSKNEYESGSLERRVSKSSSSPNISSKPKVVLNREGNDPGTVLSRGDSERVKHRKSSREHGEDRPSSRRSSGGHSRRDSYDEEERTRHKSSRSGHGARDAAAAGIAGGVLTAAALKHHDSQGDFHERRKKRSKSRGTRSRSNSIAETTDEAYLRKGDVPPMPLASQINDSEVTRESLLSQNTELPPSRGSADVRTPVREVSRGSLGDITSPLSSRTPTRTTGTNALGMSHSNHSLGSPKSPRVMTLDKSRVSQLAGIDFGATAGGKDQSTHVDSDGYGGTKSQRKLSNSSPVHSVSSLRRNFQDDEPLVPAGLRPHSAASRSSAGHLRNKSASRASARSAESSPTTTKLARSRQQSQDVSADEFSTPFERPDASFAREGTETPSRELTDEWLEREHELNDHYRHSMGGTTNRDSYTTNPYPQDEKRFTMYTDDSPTRDYDGDDAEVERDVRPLGTNPEYVHTPLAVESAVASLMEPSFVSSNMVSSTGSPTKANASYSERMAEHVRTTGKESPAVYESSTVSQNMPSEDRWAALKSNARKLSSFEENYGVEHSPRQSPAKSLREQESKPVMVASSLPLVHDPMPEIGHFNDSRSDLTTNPSIIHGPLGGDVTGKDTWPYTPEPQNDYHDRDERSLKSGHSREDGMLAAAAGGAAALAAAHHARQPTVEDEEHARSTYTPDGRRALHEEIDKDMTPVGSPAQFRGDEGYVTDNRALSGENITSNMNPTKRLKPQELDDYERALDKYDAGDDDLFAPSARRTSGDSHGVPSPLYDSSMGKGLDNIESKDIVALMDHLTVRDAQRNARDTEILVTLVRSAAEMRSSFDEMKQFILDQDKMIMQNTERGAEHAAQKALSSGPRPQPLGSPRTPRRQTTSEEEIQTKRKGVLRRALRGLTGGKSANDLAKIEDMLVQILDNVEDLKHQGGPKKMLSSSYTNESVDSYEKLRGGPDSGYEPDGQAGTSSTPSQSGHFPTTPREKQQFHSGYDGRRGSDNRISTVHEDDEDELEPHEKIVLNNQFENNERMLTPTQDLQRHRGLSPTETPPQQAATYVSPDKQRKHKSGSSSLFGIPVPKVSRWSKTTTSSAAPDPATLESPNFARNQRPSSLASRTETDLDEYDDRTVSARSVSREAERNGAHAATRSIRSQGSRLTRTPSPLIPSEASSRRQDEYYDDGAQSPLQDEDMGPEFDDPKYQAHRTSLLLQHPQPRPGNTPRHQDALENQAHIYDDRTNSDLSQEFDPAGWGSSGTAGLARHRLTQAEPMSPDYSSGKSAAAKRESLIPEPSRGPASGSGKAPKIQYDEPEDDWEEPQFSNSGFSKAGYSYSSPYGSGHLLEPIEEVRYSLETDRGNISPEPQTARAVDMRAPMRKITGPRPMGSKSPQPKLVETNGTMRRKPVGGSSGSRDTLDSETF